MEEKERRRAPRPYFSYLDGPGKWLCNNPDCASNKGDHPGFPLGSSNRRAIHDSVICDDPRCMGWAEDKYREGSLRPEFTISDVLDRTERKGSGLGFAISGMSAD